MFPAKLRRAAYHSDDEQQHPQQHEQVIDNPLSQWGEPLPAWKTLGPGPHPASAQHTGAQTWHGSTTTSALSPYQLHLSRYYKPVPRRRTPWHVVQTWAHNHPYLAAGLCVLLLLVVIFAIVAGVCSTRECRGLGWLSTQRTLGDREPEPYNVSRLLVSFTNSSIDALDLLPPVLKPYVTRLLLQTSRIQVLSFLDEDSLTAAREYLSSNPDLDYLIRDFGMGLLPNLLSGPTANTLLSQAVTYIRSGGAQTWQQYLNSTGAPTQQGGRRRAATEVKTDAHQGDQREQDQHRGNSDIGSRQLIDNAPGTASEDGGTGPNVGASAASASIPEPNDPLYASGAQWFMETIGVGSAWTAGTASPDVVVAIVDSGVDITHPDLVNNLWTNTGEIPGNGVDDDGNGFIDDVHGWDFAGACTLNTNTANAQPSQCAFTTSCSGRGLITDSGNHGTGVAGLVAAVINNGLGGVGVAPGVKIMVLRVSDCVDGTIYASAAAAAFDYAVRMGAHIVQASFGATYPYGFRPTQPAPWYHASWTRAYTQALQPLAAKGVLVVAAAGNEALDMDLMKSLGYSYCPCLVTLPNVLCVMSTEPDDSPSDFTNYGTQTVHLGAPGRVLVTTTQGSSYAPLTGSSFSAPVVTGVAALTLSVLGAADNNYTRAYQVKSALMGSITTPLQSVTITNPFLSAQPKPLPSISGGRVSANGSVTAALRLSTNRTAGGRTVALSASLPAPPSLQDPLSTSPPTTTPDPSTPSAVTSGFTDYYYQLPVGWTSAALPDVNQTAGLTLFDQTVRYDNTASFQTFKYPTGALLSIRCHLYLGRPGVWSFRVQTAGGSTSQTGGAVRLVVGGQQVPLTTVSTGTGSVTGGGVPVMSQGAIVAHTAGLYSWELQLMPPFPRTTVFVRAPAAETTSNATSSTGQQQQTSASTASTAMTLDAAGGATSWVVMTGAYQVSVTRYQPPGFGPGMTLSSNYESSLLSRGWYVRYNLTTFTSSSATNTNPPTVPLQLPRALASFLTASWPASAGATVPRPPPVTVTDATVATVSDSAWFQPPPRFVRGAYVSDMAFVGRSALVGQLQPQSTLAGGVVTLLPDSQVTQLGEVVTPVSTDGGMSGGGTLGIVGWATGVLRTSQIPTDKIVIRAMCRSCILLLNDLPVLDGWEPPPTSPTPTSTTPPLAPRQSGCIRLSPGELLRITLVFAATDLTQSPLVVGWARCDSSDVDQGVYQQFSDSVMTGDVWDVNDPNPNTGSVSGVQCDVWSKGNGMQRPGSADVGLVPSTATTTAWGSWLSPSRDLPRAPEYKVRLPGPLCAGGSGGGGDTCTWPWAFTLQALMPSLATVVPARTRYNVRCWTYWSGAFRTGPVARPTPYTNITTTNPAPLPTSVYLAGQRVWSAAWPGVSLSPSLARQQPAWATVAPSATSLGGLYQLLAVEWFGVGVGDTLALLDGGSFVVMRPGSAMLPLAVAGSVSVTNANTVTNGILGGVTVGSTGHVSVSLTPDSTDITPGLVTSNLCGLAGTAPQPVVYAPSQGLDFTAVYNVGGAGKAFYAATFGFLRNLATTPSTSIVFSLTTRQYTAVHASGVTLINTLASPAGQMNFTMSLPGGAYLPTSVIVKSSESNSDGRVTYACSVSGYTQTQTRYNGPVSKGMWYGTSVTAGSRGSDAGVCVGYVSGVVGVM